MLIITHPGFARSLFTDRGDRLHPPARTLHDVSASMFSLPFLCVSDNTHNFDTIMFRLSDTVAQSHDASAGDAGKRLAIQYGLQMSAYGAAFKSPKSIC